jgi:YfiH family protein
VRAAWIGRVAGVDVAVERLEALRRLRPEHERVIGALAGPDAHWWRPEQMHGTELAVVPGPKQVIGLDEMAMVPGVDGLLTNQPGQILGVYVADCGPVWLADRTTGAVAIVHSGRKGTEKGIVPKAIKRMAKEFGTRPVDVIAVLGPCIRPPNYEVDFAAEIGRQAEAAGVGAYHDCRRDTAMDLARCYSYRMEFRKTGRMLALIWRNP